MSLISTSIIAVPSPAGGDLQFNLSLDPVKSEAGAEFLYESCSGDYNINIPQKRTKPSGGMDYFTAVYARPQFPGVPVIRVSGKVTNQASQFDALVVPAPSPSMLEQEAEKTHSTADTQDPVSDTEPRDDSMPDLPTDSTPDLPTTTTPPQPVPTLKDIKRQLKLLRQASFKLRCPFLSADNLPVGLLPCSSKAEKLDFINSKIETLNAAKKELQGVGAFRAFLSKWFSRD
jgi:hypothetical protein